MARVYNFSAGPSMLPEKVLRQAQAELLEYGDSGQSVMEMSHRSKWFDAIIKDTEATLRRVMNIPDNYKVGFFQGCAAHPAGWYQERSACHRFHLTCCPTRPLCQCSF